MTNRVQTLRSNAPGARPTGRLPGELYVNWADLQLGVVNPVNAPIDLLPIRFFSTAASYVIGDHVLQAGMLYVAIAAVAPGPFDPTQWVANSVGDLIPLIDARGAGDNRIINGDMRIDQRGVASGVGGQAIGYTVDRWEYGGSQPGMFAWERLTAPAGPPQFPYYLAAGSQSAYTLAATDYFQFIQPIEADMVSDFAWGTPNAQPVTLSFWAYASVSGVFSGSISNVATTRSYPFTYSIPVANTWTKIVVTIPGDTSGTWVAFGNGAWGSLRFDLGCGANFRTSANAWAAGNYVGATGAVSVVTTNGALFLLTGVKLEIGSVATPYNRQSLAKSMADCQRYYQTGAVWTAIVAQGAGTYGQQTMFPMLMRAGATVVLGSITSTNSTGLAVSNATAFGFLPAASAVAAGGASISATFTASAEL